MSKQKADRPKTVVLWRLVQGAAGAGLGATAAAALLVGMRAFGVGVIGDLAWAYGGIGTGAGFFFGLLFPPRAVWKERDGPRPPDRRPVVHRVGQFREGEPQRGGMRPENSWPLGIGVVLCGLACLFVVWGWIPYRALPICTAVAKGKASSSVTTTTYRGGKITGSGTMVSFTYEVGGVEYRGAGSTTTVWYDPARPDVYFPDDNLEATRARIVEAPWMFAGGVTFLLIGVLFATPDRDGWVRMWRSSLAMALLGAVIISAVIVWDDMAINERLSGKVGRAKREMPGMPGKGESRRGKRPVTGGFDHLS